ncbi:hypothetical protein V2G26_010122 [Clonostachys chloroleuca]
MRLSNLLAGATLAFATSSQALNILLNNDDGFGSANLREVYRLLKKDGHDVWIVAPALPRADREAGQNLPSTPTSRAHLSITLFPRGNHRLARTRLTVISDYVLPRFADFKVPDLVVTGPNYGTNLGPFVWTLSGTAGAAYAATHRSIPAIALSASNKATPYFDIHNETNPATWAAEVGVKVVNTVINSAPKGGPLLPLGYGLNVNIPELKGNHSDLKYVQTRMTGNAHVNEAVLDAEKGTFDWANIKPYAAGVNTCVNGDCSLEGETYVVENGAVSISIYIVDYTAPSSRSTQSIMQRIKPLAPLE